MYSVINEICISEDLFFSPHHFKMKIFTYQLWPHFGPPCFQILEPPLYYRVLCDHAIIHEL